MASDWARLPHEVLLQIADKKWHPHSVEMDLVCRTWQEASQAVKDDLFHHGDDLSTESALLYLRDGDCSHVTKVQLDIDAGDRFGYQACALAGAMFVRLEQLQSLHLYFNQDPSTLAWVSLLPFGIKHLGIGFKCWEPDDEQSEYISNLDRFQELQSFDLTIKPCNHGDTWSNFGGDLQLPQLQRIRFFEEMARGTVKFRDLTLDNVHSSCVLHTNILKEFFPEMSGTRYQYDENDEIINL